MYIASDLAKAVRVGNAFQVGILLSQPREFTVEEYSNKFRIGVCHPGIIKGSAGCFFPSFKAN